MQTRFSHEAAHEKWGSLLVEQFKASPERAAWMSVLCETAVIQTPGIESYIFEDNGYPNAEPGVTTGLIGNVAFENPNNLIPQDRATPKGSGDQSAALFGLQLHVAQNTVGFDLLPVIPISLPSVKFIFADEYYAGGQINTAYGNDNPIYIQLSGGNLTNAVSAFTTQPAKGDLMFVTQANAGGTAVADGNAILVKFMQRHRFTGAWVVKVISTGTVATATYTPGNTLNVADVIGTQNALTKATNATTVLSSAGNAIYCGAGVPVVIELVSAVDNTVNAGSNSDGLTDDPMDRATAEVATKITLGARMWSTTVAVRDYEIRADLNRIQRRDMQAHGYDPDQLLNRAGKNQITQSINSHILRTLFRLGVESHASLRISQGVDFNLFVGPSSTANKALSSFTHAEFVDTTGTSKVSVFGNIANAVSNSSAESHVTRQRMLSSKIFAAASLIATVSRYGGGDQCVVNSQLAAALRDNKGFTAAPIDNTLTQSQSTLYYLGDLAGIRMYCDPSMLWNDTRVLVGRKGTEEDSGLKFFAYQLVDSVSTIAESTMAPVYLFTSSYALAAVGHNPASNYLTFSVANDFGIWT